MLGCRPQLAENCHRCLCKLDLPALDAHRSPNKRHIMREYPGITLLCWQIHAAFRVAYKLLTRHPRVYLDDDNLQT